MICRVGGNDDPLNLLFLSSDLPNYPTVNEYSRKYVVFGNFKNRTFQLPFGSSLNLYGYCFWLYVGICIGIGVGIVVARPVTSSL